MFESRVQENKNNIITCYGLVMLCLICSLYCVLLEKIIDNSKDRINTLEKILEKIIISKIISNNYTAILPRDI